MTACKRATKPEMEAAKRIASAVDDFDWTPFCAEGETPDQAKNKRKKKLRDEDGHNSWEATDNKGTGQNRTKHPSRDQIFNLDNEVWHVVKNVASISNDFRPAAFQTAKRILGKRSNDEDRYASGEVRSNCTCSTRETRVFFFSNR
jgi:hypothetical protein